MDLGGNPHTVLMFGSSAVAPIIDVLNECANAGLKAYAEYTIDPRPYDFYNLQTTPEHQLKLQECYNLQTELEKVHIPNFMFRIHEDEIEEFASTLIDADTRETFTAVVERWGIRRSSPDFWPVLNSVTAYTKPKDPRRAGTFDINRYKNL